MRAYSREHIFNKNINQPLKSANSPRSSLVKFRTVIVRKVVTFQPNLAKWISQPVYQIDHYHRRVVTACVTCSTFPSPQVQFSHLPIHLSNCLSLTENNEYQRQVGEISQSVIIGNNWSQQRTQGWEGQTKNGGQMQKNFWLMGASPPDPHVTSIISHTVNKPQ